MQVSALQCFLPDFRTKPPVVIVWARRAPPPQVLLLTPQALVGPSFLHSFNKVMSLPPQGLGTCYSPMWTSFPLLPIPPLNSSSTAFLPQRILSQLPTPQPRQDLS